MSEPTPEQREKRKREAIQKLNETPERIKVGFQQIRLLVVVTAGIFGDDRELMLRTKFKVEEMREAFLDSAEKCNNLLKEIEGHAKDGNKDPDPPKAA
jgi:hypothetical protein